MRRLRNFFDLIAVKAAIKDWLIEAWLIYWALIKIMVPVLLIVRVIELLGWIEVLGEFIEPLMGMVGLPGETGLVWMANMFGNIYAGMAVFYQLGLAGQLTIAQVSVLGALMLLAHSLPIEVMIARATGVSVWFTLLLRIGGALVLGMILHITYSYFYLLQEPAPMLWQPQITSSTWINWFATQGKTLVAALLIITGLTLLIRVLRFIGVEKIIHALLSPVLRILGISIKASNIMIIGLTLGLSFGGGLLIKEARSGKVDAKDVFLTMAFLGLCHSLIEDTLLILLLGADLTTALWVRLAFSLLVIVVLARIAKRVSTQKQRWFYRRPS
jgi:hypothetical protein